MGLEPFRGNNELCGLDGNTGVTVRLQGIIRREAMSSWRPDEDKWMKRANERVEEILQSPFSEVEMAYFEAGADAMLEALKSTGKYNYSGYGRTDFPNARYGWFVFIPEEQP